MRKINNSTPEHSLESLATSLRREVANELTLSHKKYFTLNLDSLRQTLIKYQITEIILIAPINSI